MYPDRMYPDDGGAGPQSTARAGTGGARRLSGVMAQRTAARSGAEHE
jgi:hypothetical protein